MRNLVVGEEGRLWSIHNRREKRTHPAGDSTGCKLVVHVSMVIGQ